MSALSRAWDRTREPLPCQYAKGVCIRCRKAPNTSLMWRCDATFYGPGDAMFRIARFLNLRTCDPCHDRRKTMNLLWHQLLEWLYAGPQRMNINK